MLTALQPTSTQRSAESRQRHHGNTRPNQSQECPASKPDRLLSKHASGPANALASPLLQGIRLSCCSLLGQTQKTFIAAFLAPAPNQDVSRTAKDGGRGGDAGGSTTPPKCSVRPLAAHRRADAQPGLHLPPHAIPLLSPLWPTARVWNVRDPAVLEGPCTPTAPAWRSPHRLPLAHPIP